MEKKSYLIKDVDGATIRVEGKITENKEEQKEKCCECKCKEC